MKEGIVVIDYGSQYTQLIARRIREQGVYSSIIPSGSPINKIIELEPKGIILSGGPSSVYDKGAPQLNMEILNLNLPILGICYGMQLLAHCLSGAVKRSKIKEYGHSKVKKIKESLLLKNIPNEFTAWMSHGDSVEKLPENFIAIISSENCPFAGIEDSKKKIYGLQFHPEVIHTEYGENILKNFIFEIAGCKINWDINLFTEKLIKNIKEQTEGGKILTAVSGGVDSTILSYILFKAVGKRMIAIFINNGLLRKNEVNKVKLQFKSLGIPIRIIDASKEFLKNLQNITDPERKRKIIGKTFVKVFGEIAKEIKDIKYFAQGTLYPDVVESGQSIGSSAIIKTHHNLVKEVKKMGFKIIEPFRDLFKDEVRKIGKLNNLPEEIINQHPFPGPGLAVRIIGKITNEKLELIRKVDEIIIGEIKASNYYNELWQCFPVLLPVKTVGVMGDKRSYGYVVALRAVKSLDGMTANWANLPYELLNKISTRIVNEVKGINRVIYDITNKPPATIEWE